MKVNSTDFQNAVGKYLSIAEKQPIIITRNGKSVAKLTAYRDPDQFLIDETKGQYKIKRKICYAEYQKLVKNSDQRYEFIAGEVYLLASPSYQHQRTIREILIRLHSFLGKGPCQVLTAPFDVRLYGYPTKSSEDPNVVQPDLVVICDPDKITDEGKYEGVPALIVEVLSPTTRGKDLITKLHLYARSGVREYWIVDPAQKWIVQYGFSAEGEPQKTEMLAKGATLTSAYFPGLTMRLTEIFD